MANAVAELVFIPAPAMGHINPVIEFAKLLVSRDQRLSITVLLIKPHSIMGSAGSTVTTYIESLTKKASERISFIELLQDETLPAKASFQDIIDSHCESARKVMADIMSQPGSVRRVAGIVIDMLRTKMIDVANEFNLPTYVLYASNASFHIFTTHIQTLCDDENQDVVELSNSDALIPIPGFAKPVPTKVFPSVIQTKDKLDLVLKAVRKLREAKAILINTFLELETHAVESLSLYSHMPPVYPVGPLLNLEGTTMIKLDDDVTTWLDSQPPSSVVVLCFGSMGSFDEVQVKEIALALEKSGYRFVWSLRQPPSKKQESISPGDYEDVGLILPEGFLERTSGIGKVIGFAPQVALLAHRSVGGFVTHCGWNSLLESLWFGVPMAAWPIYGEQQLNAFEMVELGLAVEVKLDYKKELLNIPDAKTVIVTSEEIENGIRQLMEDEEVRTKVKEMSEKSRAAVMEGGSSYSSVGSLIEEFIQNVS